MMREVSSSLKENKAYFDGSLQINQSFDLLTALFRSAVGMPSFIL